MIEKIIELDNQLKDTVEFIKIYEKLHSDDCKKDHIYRVITTFKTLMQQQYDKFNLNNKDISKLKRLYNKLTSMQKHKDMIISVLNTNEELNIMDFSEEEVTRNGKLLNKIEKEIKKLNNEINKITEKYEKESS